MSSFQGEKEEDKNFMLRINIIITVILGIGALAIWCGKSQSVADKVSVGILYLISLIFYLCT